MTSVNSPACLLARNHFYRNMSASPEPMKPVYDRHRQRQVTVWITIATTGFPGGVGSSGLWANIVLGSSSSPLRLSAYKPLSPPDRGVKHEDTNTPHQLKDRKEVRTSGSN